MGYIEDTRGNSIFIASLPVTCPNCLEKVFRYKLISKVQVQSKQYVQGQNTYSVKKGIAGTILFGGFGAVMGINGKKGKSYYVGEDIYHYTIMCPRCNFTFTASNNE